MEALVRHRPRSLARGTPDGTRAILLESLEDLKGNVVLDLKGSGRTFGIIPYGRTCL